MTEFLTSLVQLAIIVICIGCGVVIGWARASAHYIKRMDDKKEE